jgi:tetratricopeptide (TPR) repeat protein
VLGLAYYEAGKYLEAIETYKKAIKNTPYEVSSYVALGGIYLESGMYQEAVIFLNQAIRTRPDCVGAHYLLGATYIMLNEKGAALEEYRILKDINPNLANKLLEKINQL